MHKGSMTNEIAIYREKPVNWHFFRKIRRGYLLNVVKPNIFNPLDIAAH
jgi:hypothetical protein